MTEQRQNDVCCEVLREARGLVLVVEAPDYTELYPCLRIRQGTRHWHWFTQSHENLHELRAAVIEAKVWGDFVSWLCVTMGSGDAENDDEEYDLALLMQATPAQQVEAALRALGKWEQSP